MLELLLCPMFPTLAAASGVPTFDALAARWGVAGTGGGGGGGGEGGGLPLGGFYFFWGGGGGGYKCVPLFWAIPMKSGRAGF